MILTKKQLNEYLQIEKPFYIKSKKELLFSFFSISESGILWKYQKRLRVWEYHQNAGHRIRCAIWKFRTIRIGRKYNISISPNCFGKGMHIMHLGSILVNSETRVGDYCLLNINVAFVSTSGKNGAPKLGSHCKIGIGATLIGDICLQNNIVVGAGAVVTKSFLESNITLVGVPAYIINKQ